MESVVDKELLKLLYCEVDDLLIKFIANPSKHPPVLSTTDLTKLLNKHLIKEYKENKGQKFLSREEMSTISISRITVRKHLLELMGKGLVQQDQVGVSKIWSLTPEDQKGIPKIAEKEWFLIDKIFDLLVEQGQRWSIQEIADNLAVNRNTGANMLAVMTQLNLIEREGQGRNVLWQIKTPEDFTKVAFQQIAVVLVEVKEVSEEKRANDHSNPSNKEKEGWEFNVVSMNATARQLAMIKDRDNEDQTLKKLEQVIFQRSFLGHHLEDLLSSTAHLIYREDKSIPLHLP